MKAVIDAILAAHGLPPAHTITQPSRGRNNPIYIIDDTYVVRFDGLTGIADPEYTTRFRAEQWVYDRLHEARLPVPQVIAFDESRTLAPQPYMLMTKIAGRAVIDSDDLTPAQRFNIAYALGGFLARMHNVASYDRFGKWHQLEDGTHLARWAEWPIGFFEQYARWSDELGGAVDAALVRDFRQLIADTQPYFEAVTTGVIAHRDCHFENVLQSGGQLTGVIDFEWWMSADPATDFAVEDQWEQAGAGCREAVYAGYTALRPLTSGHHEKVRVYNLLRDFDDVVTYFADGELDKSRRAAAKVRAGLDPAIP